MAKAKTKTNGLGVGEAGNITKAARKNALRFLPGRSETADATAGVTNVAQRAYHIYLEEGRPEGRHLDHWLRAESEVTRSV